MIEFVGRAEHAFFRQEVAAVSPALRHLVLGLSLFAAPAAYADPVAGPRDVVASTPASFAASETRGLGAAEKAGALAGNRVGGTGKSKAGAESGLLHGVVGPLALVLVLIGMLAGLFVLVSRLRGAGKGSLSAAFGAGGRAPAGILEVMGRYPLAHGLTLVLLKLDRRVLLLSQTRSGRLGGYSLATICELDSPEDVASILLKVRDAENESLTRKFASVFRSLDREAVEKVQGCDATVMTSIAPSPTPPSRARGISSGKVEKQFSIPAGGEAEPGASIRSRLEQLRFPRVQSARGAGR